MLSLQNLSEVTRYTLVQLHVHQRHINCTFFLSDGDQTQGLGKLHPSPQDLQVDLRKFTLEKAESQK
jgi:hypothetical protein